MNLAQGGIGCVHGVGSSMGFRVCFKNSFLINGNSGFINTGFINIGFSNRTDQQAMEQLDCEFESYPILTVIASGANCHHDSSAGFDDYRSGGYSGQPGF
ncbi:MAG: hypothetical protein KDK05_22890 [Candidatus Competibacteraceae bacterium]|nr:hypothetical protein [Candidatus Competibacteraceae bacterium]